MHAKKTGRKRSARSDADTTSERLNQVLATFATLRDDGRALIARIHGSLMEMRQLREQIREHRNNRRNAPSNGDARSRLSHSKGQFGLTAREAEVAKLLAQGRSNVAIAKALGISTHTARHHTQRILAKLRVHSRAEAGAKLRG
jgi:DNA-binding CsgD family transcriptional regulator